MVKEHGPTLSTTTATSSKPGSPPASAPLTASPQASSDFLELMLSAPSEPVELPGKNSTYVYSQNYTTIERLVSKIGSSMGLSDPEFDVERESIWLKLKPKFEKVDETVPFSGVFAVGSVPKIQHSKKRYQMKLRRKRKALDQEADTRVFSEHPRDQKAY